jgi:hypothetical protein
MNNDHKPKLLKAFFLISILLLLFSGTALSQYSVGDTVANFTLNDIYGNLISLYYYQGEVILLNFFATW